MDCARVIARLRQNQPWFIGVEPAVWPRALEVAEQEIQSQPSPIVVLAERQPLLFWAKFLVACQAERRLVLANPDWGELEWQQIQPGIQPDLIGYGPDILIPTGGTSGQVRFAIHTWETLAAAVLGFQRHFQVEAVNCLCLLPFYHVSGLMQGLRSLLSGGELANQSYKALEQGQYPDRDPADWFVSLVPTQLVRLLEARSVSLEWLRGCRAILLGGAPAWADLLDWARHERLPLAPTYGMTETAAQIATLHPDAFLQGKTGCGQILPHATVQIVDEAGFPVTGTQVGHVQIQANSLFLGYCPPHPVAPQVTVFQPDDLGYLDGDGSLHIQGRASDKIITGGENVFPAEVEAVLWATGFVTDVCVVGLPDRHWGQAVTAVYVTPAGRTVNPTQLQAALTGQLSSFKRPKHWIAVPQMPRNAQGKVNRQAVLALAQSTLQGH